MSILNLEFGQHPSCRWLVAVPKIREHEVRFFPGETLLAPDSQTAGRWPEVTSSLLPLMKVSFLILSSAFFICPFTLSPPQYPVAVSSTTSN